MYLFNYVNVIPDCISSDLIYLFKNLPKEDATPALVGYNNKEKKGKDRITNWITLPPDIVANTTQAIRSLYDNVLRKIYIHPIKDIELPQLLHYNVGGKYEEHNDSEDFIDGQLCRVCERDVTVLVYLNDDYEGGELELAHWGVKFKPRAGTVITFPSYIEFTHRVHPVTKGERLNLVSWICTHERIYPRPYS